MSYLTNVGLQNRNEKGILTQPEAHCLLINLRLWNKYIMGKIIAQHPHLSYILCF